MPLDQPYIVLNSYTPHPPPPQEKKLKKFLLVYAIGGFHSILIHRQILGGHLYAYYCFMPCGSEQISLNCIFFQANISLISIMNI